MLGLGLNTAGTSAAAGESLERETSAYSLYLSGPNDTMRGARTTTSFQDWTANQDWSLRFQIELDTIASAQTIAQVGVSTDYIWIQAEAGSGRLLVTTVASSTTISNPVFSTSISASTWTEIVITCDSTSGSSKVFTCYQDGSAVATFSETIPVSSSTSLLPPTGKAFWGSFFNVVDYDFKIDNIASFRTVLSADEVSEIYNSQPILTKDYGNYASSSNLKSYYRLDEGSGSTAADSSDNASATDYSLINSPAWSTDVMFPG